jgi:hypothetical protein
MFPFGELKTATRLFSTSEKVSRRATTLGLSSLPERTRGPDQAEDVPGAEDRSLLTNLRNQQSSAPGERNKSSRRKHEEDGVETGSRFQ